LTYSNVPSPTLGDNGFVAPTEAAIKAGRWQDLQTAFGGGLTQSDATPQGQIVASDTAIIGDANNQFLALANGVDPAYASGRMQDAIGRIYFLTRIPAAATVVTATASGASGTVIPVGALAEDVNGYRYACTDGGTIPASGTLNLTWQCVTLGPIACAAGALTKIYRTIPGWDSVVNAAAGIIGRNVETRRAFEDRRKASVAKNAHGSPAAILGAILEVSGVLDAYVVDNPEGSPQTIGGVTIAAHSVYCCVYGGTSADVASAIWTKKSNGSGYTGNTSVVVYDTSAPYVAPFPQYAVRFQRPETLPIKISVNLSMTPTAPSNAVSLIKAALQSAFAGGDGGERARIGATIYASRFYAPVASIGAWVRIQDILVGTEIATAYSVSVGIDQIPALDDSNIFVVIQ
jgi:hypothetical protein